ncbi:MAG: hypothetical protein HYS25_15625 [Ignavibacteriales bacterium]|nr:hypothetical protein [Ignavibacteriales bacterium]
MITNMDNISKTSKIILFITITFFALWLGGYVLRQLVVYQFFEVENLELRAIYNPDNLTAVYFSLLPVFVSNLITYFVFLIFFIAFVATSKIKIKSEGWLLIIILLIAVTAPFEIYLLTFDYKIADNIYSADSSDLETLNLIKERMTALSSFSLIEVFSFISVLFLAIFRPLRKS